MIGLQWIGGTGGSSRSTILNYAVVSIELLYS